MSIAGEQFLNYTNLSNIPPINTTRSEIMSISGTSYIKMWIPNPSLVHGPDFQGGPPAGGPPVGDPTAGAPGGAGANNASNEAAPNVQLKDYGTPGENFFEGDMTFHFTPNPDGTLSGDADGTPILFGYYTGDEFFKVGFQAGPGRWEVWAKVDAEGFIEGIISVGDGKGFPNFVYGKKCD